MQLFIVSSSYGLFSIDVDTRWTIDYLKTKAVSYFLSGSDASKQSVYFKLISSKKATVLCDNKSIKDHRICSNGRKICI